LSRKSTSKPKHQDFINEVLSRIEKVNSDPQDEGGYTEKETVGGVLRDIDSPTLVVEGPDDVTIYRWIVETYFNGEIKLVPVGGRSEVEKIYKNVYANRHKYPFVPIVFIADKDMDVFSKPPLSHKDIIWTEGYSIENDLYTVGEAELRKLLKGVEPELYQKVLNTIIEWFAFEVQQYKSGRPINISAKLKNIVPIGADTPPTEIKMGHKFRETRGLNPPEKFCVPDKAIHKEVKDGYRRKLRGKYLFDVLVRYLNYQGREPQYGRIFLWDRVFRADASKAWRIKMVNRIKDRINKDSSRIRRLQEKKGSK
jgi:hypothetical protein